jgi:oxysterol-binding protein-related protein 3/6/7
MFKAPELPSEIEISPEYGMNWLSMNLGQMTEELKAKLPPTDSRFRPDLKMLEEKNVKGADLEKERIEENQTKRHEARVAKAREEGNEAPEVELHKPCFFSRETTVDESGKTVYDYKIIEGKYWQQREDGKWLDSPHIFSDDCADF